MAANRIHERFNLCAKMRFIDVLLETVVPVFGPYGSVMSLPRASINDCWQSHNIAPTVSWRGALCKKADDPGIDRRVSPAVTLA